MQKKSPIGLKIGGDFLLELMGSKLFLLQFRKPGRNLPAVTDKRKNNISAMSPAAVGGERQRHAEAIPFTGTCSSDCLNL